jgi:hypothetical protein
LTTLLWTQPSAASRYRDEYDAREFQQCVAELRAANIVVEQADIACAMALEPTDLSECVLSINTFTVLAGDVALFSCFRVRRPVELAECVVDINAEVLEPRVSGEALGAIATATLDHCRRSLLPLRFSACVRGLDREILYDEPRQALSTCIDAEDFPREIYTPATNSTQGRGL